MKKLLVLASLTLLSFVEAAALENVLRSNQIQGSADLQNRLGSLKGKEVKLAFTMQGCGACNALKAATNPRGTILSIEPGAANEELLTRYGVQAFPTVVLLDGNGVVTHTAVGRLDAQAALEK